MSRWGWSRDEEYFNLVFGNTKEDAVAEGANDIGDPGEVFVVALCEQMAIRSPDIAEIILDGAEEDASLFEAVAVLSDKGLEAILSEAFCGANDDVDYEGDLAEAIEEADYTALVAAVRLVKPETTADELDRLMEPYHKVFIIALDDAPRALNILEQHTCKVPMNQEYIDEVLNSAVENGMNVVAEIEDNLEQFLIDLHDKDSCCEHFELAELRPFVENWRKQQP